MDLKFIRSESTVRPDPIDSTSSQTHTYVRRNVQEETRTDSEGNTITMYVYEECTMPKNRYELYETDTGAQLAIAELAETIEQNATDMGLAIAELAEALVS